MAQTATLLEVSRRTHIGSGGSRKLRANGAVPAVLYGHKQEPTLLAVPLRSLQALLRHGAHGLLSLKYDDGEESAVIKDMQWDVFGLEILHVDFLRVSAGERVTVPVPIVLKGEAPGVRQGGVLEHPMMTIELECPADNLLESLVVHIDHLEMQGAIYVRDLKLPAGVTVKEVPSQLVAHVVPSQQETAEPETLTAAEPELIRREKPTED